MEILVTGGSGAIGTFVVEALRSAGHSVTILDREPPADDDVQFICGDITDQETVREAVSEVDVVVHLAALLPKACRQSPHRADAVNIGGSLNVFEAATEQQVRVIYASSKAVFGAITGVHAHPTYEPLSEDAPKSPTNLYGVTKAAVERFATAYVENGLDGAALRFASTYGPGKGEAHGDLAILPEAIRQAAAGNSVKLSGADQRNDLLYYVDIAQGVTAAVETTELSYNAYHIGSGVTCSIREFASAVEKHTEASVDVEEGTDYRDATAPSYCRLDISRARADLGYEPSYPVDAGVRHFLKYINERPA
jgi:UDP-glucose 4-epimerase